MKGKDAKKYFLEKTTEKLGVRFQEIPKDSLILEEIGSSKMAFEIFKDALEMNFLEDVEFQVEKITKQTVGENVESENLPSNTNGNPNRKGLGNDQRKILKFMENHRGEEFSINSLSIATDYVKSKLRIILSSLVKRNLNDSFSVEAIRRKCNHEEAAALTEVIRVLSGEAIQYSPDDDDIYNVNIIWRTYSLVRLGQKDIETEKSSEIIELLLTKGLIYEEPEGKYNIVM